MKLVLASAGFYTKEIAETTAKLASKSLSTLNVAIINEASAVEAGDKTWFIDELTRIRQFVGSNIDFVNLLALKTQEVSQRLDEYDVIYVMGGDTDYLMHVFNKTGFTQLLPKLLESKVYIGSSAGSMVLGRRVSSEAYWKIYGPLHKDYGVREYMKFVDFAMKPHMNSTVFPNNTPENLSHVTKGCNFDIYGLADEQAIIYDNGNVSFIGGSPYKVGADL